MSNFVIKYASLHGTTHVQKLNRTAVDMYVHLPVGIFLMTEDNIIQHCFGYS